MNMKKGVSLIIIASILFSLNGMDPEKTTKDPYDYDPRKFVCNEMHTALKDYFNMPSQVNPRPANFNTDIAKEQRQHLFTLQKLLSKCGDKELSDKAKNFAQIVSARIEHEEKESTCSTYFSLWPRSPENVQKCRNKSFGKYLNQLLYLEKQ